LRFQRAPIAATTGRNRGAEREIRLSVPRDNLAGQQFYAACGGDLVGERKVKMGGCDFVDPTMAESTETA
jgi:hypothetical protein